MMDDALELPGGNVRIVQALIPAILDNNMYLHLLADLKRFCAILVFIVLQAYCCFHVISGSLCSEFTVEGEERVSCLLGLTRRIVQHTRSHSLRIEKLTSFERTLKETLRQFGV